MRALVWQSQGSSDGVPFPATYSLSRKRVITFCWQASETAMASGCARRVLEPWRNQQRASGRFCSTIIRTLTSSNIPSGILWTRTLSNNQIQRLAHHKVGEFGNIDAALIRRLWTDEKFCDCSLLEACCN